MTTTLYLAWQAPKSRRWFPVGRLDADLDGDLARYHFSYMDGAREAREAEDFLMVPGFPELDAPYQSEKLFPFFENRLMKPTPARTGRIPAWGWGWIRPVGDPVSELAAPFNHTHGKRVRGLPRCRSRRRRVLSYPVRGPWLALHQRPFYRAHREVWRSERSLRLFPGAEITPSRALPSR